MRRIWMRLLGKLAHQESGLLMGKSEALHLPPLSGSLGCSLWLRGPLSIFLDHVLVINNIFLAFLLRRLALVSSVADLNFRSLST
jgi:hypothetical protein